MSLTLHRYGHLYPEPARPSAPAWTSSTVHRFDDNGETVAAFSFTWPDP